MRRLIYNSDLIVANILFGCNFSVLVSLLTDIDHNTLFVVQIVVAAAIFLPPALLSKAMYRVSWHDMLKLFIVSMLVVGGWLYMLLWGASYTNPIDASTLATLGPIVTLIAARIASRSPMRPFSIVGVVLSFAGAALLLFDRRDRMWDVGTEVFGNALIMVAVVAIAINTVVIKPQLAKLGSRVVVGWCFLLALPPVLLLGYGQLHDLDLSSLTPTRLAELLFTLTLGSVCPLWLLYRGAEKLTALHTAIYRYIQPAIAWALAIARHQVLPDSKNISAAALILLGVVMLVVSQRTGRSGRTRTNV